jgi:molecular chaperone DnaK
VLADGVWCNQPLAIERARMCKERGIDIIAIGFGSADREFLKAVASSEANSYFTSLTALVETFSSIAQGIARTGLAAPPVGSGKPGGLGLLRGGRAQRR